MFKSKKTATILALLVAIAVITLIMTTWASASDILVLEGNTVQAAAGEVVEVTISLTNNPGFIGMNLYYTYDTEALSLVGTRSMVQGGALTFTHDKTSVWDGLNDYTQEGALVTLTFRVAETAAAGSYEIKIHFIEAFDEDLNDVYANTVSGYIQVGCAHRNTENVSEVPPTCISEGYTAGVRCQDCGIFVSGHQKLDKLTIHTWGSWKETTDGAHKHVCDVCGLEERASHEWDKGTLTKPATHTSEGVMTFACTVCHASRVESVAKIPDHSFGAWLKDSPTHHKRVCSCGQMESGVHNWDNGVITEDATHYKSGNRIYTCRDCGETKTEVIPQIEHTFDQKRTTSNYLKKEATCTDAAVYYFSCSCGAKGTATFTIGEATGHSFFNYVYNKDATCVLNGTETAVCSSCDATDTREKKASALGHDWSAKWLSNSQGHFHVCDRCQDVTTVSPHVSSGNATEYTDEICTVCQYVITPALGHIHKMVAVAATAPTCTKDGNTDYYYCNSCEKQFRDVTAKQEILDSTEIVIPAVGHTRVEDAAVSATCTESGLTAGAHCSVCSFVILKQTVIPAKGHREVYDDGYRATCTENGLTEGSHCSVCQTVLVQQEVIPAKGHTPGVAATCTSKQICTVCGEILHENLGHAYEDRFVASTCTESGYTVHTCTRCGDQFKDSYQNATGHKPGGEASCTSDQICSACGTVMTQKYGHTYRDETRMPTCTEAGYTLHTCERCGVNYKDAYTDATGHKAIHAADCETDSVCANCNQMLAAKLGHDYRSVVTEPTCTESGSVTHTCSRCGHQYTDGQKDALGHTEIVDEAVAPTCTQEGKTEGKHCSVCGEVLVAQETVPVLGHTEGDWIVVKEPAVGQEGSRQKQCTACGEVLSTEPMEALTEEITIPSNSDTEPPTESSDSREESASTETGEEITTAEQSTEPQTGGCGGSINGMAGCLMLLAIAMGFTAVRLKRKE